jgi:hypothetical protein
VLEKRGSGGDDVMRPVSALFWGRKWVMMAADEPESFALDATRVIAYPDLRSRTCDRRPDKSQRVSLSE